MRLLDVQTFEFVERYRTPEELYAVASHRWNAGNEAMFTDVKHGTQKDTSGYKKVEGFVKYLRDHFPEIGLLWIDTCCINQDSEREVSEAVNSMYRWYSNAEICLAYLADVDHSRHMRKFMLSEWFTRGWTLQELLAPETVIFLSSSWETIGHKGPNRTHSGTPLRYGDWPLEDILVQITQIPRTVLNNDRHITSYDVNTKLAWMEGRETSREEDIIYSMFGIFDVVLPIIYGETVTRARRRLLKEIELNEAETSHTRSRRQASPQRSPNLPPGRGLPNVRSERESPSAPLSKVFTGLDVPEQVPNSGSDRSQFRKQTSPQRSQTSIPDRDSPNLALEQLFASDPPYIKPASEFGSSQIVPPTGNSTQPSQNRDHDREKLDVTGGKANEDSGHIGNNSESPQVVTVSRQRGRRFFALGPSERRPV